MRKAGCSSWTTEAGGEAHGVQGERFGVFVRSRRQQEMDSFKTYLNQNTEFPSEVPVTVGVDHALFSTRLHF